MSEVGRGVRLREERCGKGSEVEGREVWEGSEVERKRECGKGSEIEVRGMWEGREVEGE